MDDLNVVALSGRLARDPDLRHTPSGTSVCSLRLAFTTSRKANDQWQEKSNYVDITVWGRQGESCAQYLSKGSPVSVQGRLEWREWDADDGTKRQAYEIVSDRVIFHGSRDGGGGSSGGGSSGSNSRSDFQPTPAAADDDIPF